MSSTRKKFPILLSSEEICMAMAVLTQASDELRAAVPEGMGSLTAEKLEQISGDIWFQMEQQKNLVREGLHSVN